LNEPKKYILHLPQWYPSAEDAQFGVFTQKHIRSASPYFDNVVIYILGVEHDLQDPNPEVISEEDISGYIVRYRKAGKKGLAGLMVNACRYYSSFRKAWKLVKNSHGMPSLVNAHVLLKPARLAILLPYRYRISFFITEDLAVFVRGFFL